MHPEDLLRAVLQREFPAPIVLSPAGDPSSVAVRTERAVVGALRPESQTLPAHGVDHVVVVAQRMAGLDELLARIEQHHARWVSVLLSGRMIDSPRARAQEAIEVLGSVHSIVWVGDLVRSILVAADTPNGARDHAIVTIDRARGHMPARVGVVPWHRGQDVPEHEVIGRLFDESIHVPQDELFAMPWTRARFSHAYRTWRDRVGHHADVRPLASFASVERSFQRAPARRWRDGEPTHAVAPVLERELLRRSIDAPGREQPLARTACLLDDVRERDLLRAGDAVLVRRTDGGVGCLLAGPRHQRWVLETGLTRVRFHDSVTDGVRHLVLAQLAGDHGRLLIDAAGAEFDVALRNVEVAVPHFGVDGLTEVIESFVGLRILR